MKIAMLCHSSLGGSGAVAAALSKELVARGHEVHIWYPEGDKGTAGMLNVLNSGYEGRQTYNFDSEQADYSHDDMYRFHDCK